MMQLINSRGDAIEVELLRETAKAVLVKGNCSEAWIPKRAIGAHGQIADWFNGDMSYAFLFIAASHN